MSGPYTIWYRGVNYSDFCELIDAVTQQSDRFRINYIPTYTGGIIYFVHVNEYKCINDVLIGKLTFDKESNSVVFNVIAYGATEPVEEFKELLEVGLL